MLTATHLGATDITDLVPVLITASGAITTAVDQMNVFGRDIRAAITEIMGLPDAFAERAKGATEELAYSAGKGAARGFGWNILPPLAVGMGVIISGLLLYSLAMRRIEPKGTYARRK